MNLNVVLLIIAFFELFLILYIKKSITKERENLWNQINLSKQEAKVLGDQLTKAQQYTKGLSQRYEQDINTLKQKSAADIQRYRAEALERVEIAGRRANEEIERARREADVAIQRAKRETEESKQLVNEQAEKEIENVKHAALIDIQRTREEIETRKEEISTKTEREVLTEILYGLGTYADRISRLENEIKNSNTESERVQSSMQIILSNIGASIARIENINKATSVSQCHFAGRITENMLLDIALAEAKKFGRITETYEKNGIILCRVKSIQGNSDWVFRINFNDNGKITGGYQVRSDNSDSTIPNQMAEAIRKEIIYRLHA